MRITHDCRRFRPASTRAVVWIRPDTEHRLEQDIMQDGIRRINAPGMEGLQQLEKRDDERRLAEQQGEAPLDHAQLQIANLALQILPGRQMRQVDPVRRAQGLGHGFRLLLGKTGHFELFDELVGIEG